MMYHQKHQAPVRSAWSEFSLRSCPAKIKRFQAGTRDSSDDDVCGDWSKRTERDLLRPRPSLQTGNMTEDSIDADVFTIAMSYPEGRQRMFNKMNGDASSCHGNKEQSVNKVQDRKKSDKIHYNKGQISSSESHDNRGEMISGKDHVELCTHADKKGQGSRELSEQLGEKHSLSNILRKYTDKTVGRNQCQIVYRSKSQGKDKLRERSRSPIVASRKCRMMFTAKERVERQHSKFSLRDILEKHTDEAELPENDCSIVNKDHHMDAMFEDSILDTTYLNEDQKLDAMFGDNIIDCTKLNKDQEIDINVDGSSAADTLNETEESGGDAAWKTIPTLNIANSHTWIDELSSTEDGSLLALLNSPDMEDENNNVSPDETEVDSDDARYYYENMVNWKEMDPDSPENVWPNGSLVWGRLSKTKWWPAVVIDGPMAGQKPTKGNWSWLMWFGDHKISKMRLSHVVSFVKQFRRHCRGKLSSVLEDAIVEALKVCADRAGVQLDGYNTIRRWGLLEMGFLNIVDNAGRDVDPFVPKTGSEFPALILKELRKLREQSKGSDCDCDEGFAFQNGEYHERSTLLTSSGLLETDISKDVDFCLSCGKHGRKLVCQHPLFKGFVCGKCKDALMESLLALDNDGCSLFCAVCGEGGELYVCEEKDCGRSFCMRCMKHYLSTDALNKVRCQSPWSCFLCTNYSLESHGVVVPREGWREEVIKFYNPASDQGPPSCDTTYFMGRKLRVLSLFDGIGSVGVALEQLGLDVEAYFASENDACAQHVSMFNQGFSILHIGDVYSITKVKLQEICPIDLVVASPPSEDLDVTNREYEGFNGSGMFMMKFLLILRELEAAYKGHNSIYWLVESTAAMKSEYRKTLSNFFQMEPCMWDAQFFSPYILPKLYWGNVPGLYSAIEYYKGNKTNFTHLESYLAANVNRTAHVTRLRNCAIDMHIVCPGSINTSVAGECDSDAEDIPVRTIEGKMNSAMNCTVFTLPVLMEGKQTNIWIGEVEKVLGLPIHYTDVSRLNTSQRQKLLKQASSVYVLKHLLSPLTKLFVTKM